MKITSDSKRLDVAARLMGYANRSRYQIRAKSLFRGISLTGKHVVEVGCGNGAWAIWAALHGAERVLGIDPAANGSTACSLTTFKHAIETLDLADNVNFTSDYLDQLPPDQGPFDVVVMFNVINHLDECAVIELHKCAAARMRYVELLSNVRRRMCRGGWLIAADSGRTNFWSAAGFRSPFAPAIEWEKHQDPKTWCGVLQEAGFTMADACWSPFQPFPRLTANRLAQFFTFSHFVLRARAN